MAAILLSYFHLAPITQVWIGFIGIVLPVILCIRMVPFGPLEWIERSKRETFNPPFWAFALVTLGGVLLRFYRLEDLSLWPNKDEGTYAIDALELVRQWKMVFFYGAGEIPPFYRLLEGLYFKWVPPSLFSQWFFPAVISTATLPLGYWAARQFYSKSFSFLCFALLALGFWPAYLGRFAMPGSFLFFWEILTLGTLGASLIASSPRKQIGWWSVLALEVAGGFYIIAPNWIAVALAVTIAVGGWAYQDLKSRRGMTLVYLFVLTAGLIPFVAEVFIQGYGGHVRSLWTGDPTSFWNNRMINGGSYLAEIFFGVEPKTFCYGPFWGGLLDPLWDGAFFMGLIVIFRMGRSLASKWFFLALGLFLFPGIASHDVEMLRVLILAPLLIVGTVFGFQTLKSRIRGGKGWVVIGSLILLSGGLDLYHLAVPGSMAWRGSKDFFESLKSAESFKSYQILNQKSKKDGPGYLFLDFVSVPLDQTLTLASYPFNATLNEGLKSVKPTWMAFLTNVNYQPFLQQRFPEAQWFVVGDHLMPWDGEIMLCVLPIDGHIQPMLENWLIADVFFHEVMVALTRLPEGKDRENVLRDFTKGYSNIQNDPFLSSSFWEIMYFNQSADKKFDEAFMDLRQIMKTGYPAAHIYNELGAMFWARKDPLDAKKAFIQAARLGGEHTLAPDNLRAIANTSGL